MVISEQTIILAPQGDYVALKNKGNNPRKTTSHKRGDVQGFSIRSRSRLMSKIAQLNKSIMPLFVTLTYPKDYPDNFEVYKAHLHKFFTLLFRHFATVEKYYNPKGRMQFRYIPRTNMGVVWKLEYQDRGAPHYHMMLYGVTLEEAQEIIPRLWFGVVGSGDINHLKWHTGELGNKPCVEVIRSWHGVKSYASKYLSKLDERTEKSGRFWGVRGKVPMSVILTFHVDIKTALEFRRAYRRMVTYVKTTRKGKRKKIKFKNKRFGFWGNNFSPDILHWIAKTEDKHTEPDQPEPPPMWLSMAGAFHHSDISFF